MEWPENLPYLSEWRITRLLLFLLRVAGVMMWFLPTAMLVYFAIHLTHEPLVIPACGVLLLIGESLAPLWGGHDMDTYNEKFPDWGYRSLKQKIVVPIILGVLPVRNMLAIPFVAAWFVAHYGWCFAYWAIVGSRS